jgi:hypothetical protein
MNLFKWNSENAKTIQIGNSNGRLEDRIMVRFPPDDYEEFID